MSNPWLKKNPFMSAWLSGANAVAGSARARATAEAKRQTASAVTHASNELLSLWTGALTGAATAPKSRKRRPARR